MGCCSQKTAALRGLALITRSNPSSSSSHLGRRPSGRQQPRWKAPTQSRQWQGDSLQRHTYTHTGLLSCHMGWRDSLRRQQLPSHSPRCSTPSPSPSPDGKQIQRKTPARHWAVQEREGFVLHTSQHSRCTTQRKSLLACPSIHRRRSLFYLQLAHDVLGLI